MKKNKSGVYMIKNNITGYMYIGCSKKVCSRMTKHLKDMKYNLHHCGKMQQDYNKHGKESFKKHILEYCSIENLRDKEKEYIHKYYSTGLLYNKQIMYDKVIKFKKIKEIEPLENYNKNDKIICLITHELFDSIEEIYIKYPGINKKSLIRNLNNKIKSFKYNGLKIQFKILNEIEYRYRNLNKNFRNNL